MHSAPRLLCGGRSLVPVVIVLPWKAELLALSVCVGLFTKPWSPTVTDLYFQFLIVRLLIDLLRHLPRVCCEAAGISHLRGEVVSVSVSISLSLSLFMSPGFVWCKLKVEEGWKRERGKPSHRCPPRSLFWALQGELFCPRLPHMDLFERIFSYFYTTQWFLSLHVK